MYELKKIAVLRCGIVLGVLYVFFGFIEAIFLAPTFALSPPPGINLSPSVLVVFVFVVLPIVFAVIGFIGGAVMAALYNLVAGWTGGIQFTFTAPPAERDGSS